MAFNRLMLTTDGKTLYAKAQQGKTLQFTRVGIGDGDVGSGSLVNRTALISEKTSLLIDVIQLTNEETMSAIVTTLKNESLTEGFYFREIGIFANDPDTQLEKLYLYDNAGADGEYIPDNQSGVLVSERLKFLISLENVETVSFVPSGNPIYLSTEDTITANPALAPSGLVGTIAQWFGWIANRIKIITGKPNWYDEPDTTLAAAKAHIDATTSVHGAASAGTANKIMIRDAAGRAQVVDPSAVQDIATKNYVDTTAIPKSLATAANDFLVASGVGVWAKKTVAEIKTLLGLGSAAYTASTAYATAAQGTTAGTAVQSVKINNGAELKSGTSVNLPAYPTSLPASDVYAWAKAATKPSYSLADIAAYGPGNITLSTSAPGTLADGVVYMVY